MEGKPVFALAVSNTIGFTLGLLPPVILDPRLESHARYGARHYPYAWIGIPLGIAVFLTTLWLARRARSGNARFLGVAPLLAGIALCQPLLLPELPHLNLVSAFFIWGTVTVVWIWVGNLDADILDHQDPGQLHSVGLEGLRQRTTFDRTLLLALVFGGGILLVVGLSIAIYNNGQFLSAANERFMLNSYTFVFYTLVAGFVVLGPVLSLQSRIRQLEGLSGQAELAPDLGKKVADLEARIEGVTRLIELAVQFAEVDPGNTLNKCRTICEKLLLAAYRSEMSDDPKVPELGSMLHNNQFTKHLDPRALRQMNAIRDMGNLGSHAQQLKLRPVDAKRAIELVLDLMDWYLVTYQRPPGGGSTGDPQRKSPP